MVSRPPSPTSSSTLSSVDTLPVSSQTSSRPPSPPSPTTKRPFQKNPNEASSSQAGLPSRSSPLDQSLSPSSDFQQSRVGFKPQRPLPESATTSSFMNRRRSSGRVNPMSSTISADLNGNRPREHEKHGFVSERDVHTSHGLSEGSSRTAFGSEGWSADATSSNTNRKKSSGFLGRLGGNSSSDSLPPSHPSSSASGSSPYTRHSSNPPPVPSTIPYRDQSPSFRSVSQTLQPPIALPTSSLNGRFSIPFQSTPMRSYNPPPRQSSLPVGLNMETLPYKRASNPESYGTTSSPYMIYQPGRTNRAGKDIERTLEEWSFNSNELDETNGGNREDNRVRKSSAHGSDISSHRTGGTYSDQSNSELSRRPSWSSFVNTTSTHALPSLLDSSPFIDINELRAPSPSSTNPSSSTMTSGSSGSNPASRTSLYGPLLGSTEASASPDVTPPSGSSPSTNLHRRVMSTGSTPPAVPAKNPLRHRSVSGTSVSTRDSPVIGYPSSPSAGSVESFSNSLIESSTEEKPQYERTGEENEDTIRQKLQRTDAADQSSGAQWKPRGDLERTRSQILAKDSFWLDEEDQSATDGQKKQRRVGLLEGAHILNGLTKQTPPVRLEVEPDQTRRLPSASASLPQSRSPSTTAVNDHVVSSPTRSRSSRSQTASVYSTNSENISPPPSSYNRYVFQPLHSPVLPFTSEKDSAPTSKRAHLLSEIRTTERSYAQDLAVVRDVYIYQLQPSTISLTQNPHPEDVAASESQTTFPSVGGSRRSSMATFETGQTSLMDIVGSSVDDGGSSADKTSKHSFSLLLMRPVSSSGVSLSTNGGYASPQPLRSPASQRSMRSNTSSSYFPSLTSPKTPIKPASSPSPSTMTASFKGDATARPPSTAELRTIFLNLDALAVLADEFASLLEDVCGTTAQTEGWDMVGEAFLNMMPRIKQAFTSYCPRQAAANSRLLEIQSNKRYIPYFTECWALVQPFTSSWDLPSMLIKPVQRLLKYPLLLDDLLKCTPSSHPDYSKIKQASSDIRHLADEINEIKRRKDTVSSVMRKDKESAVISASHPHSSVLKDHGGKFKKGGVMTAFRKDKVSVPTTTGATSTSLFTVAFHEQLRRTEKEYAGLVNKLISAETAGKRMSGLMNGLASRTKDTWLAQMQIIEDWRRMINLQGIESLEDIRVEAYTDTVVQILDGPYRKFESELRRSISPAVSKLSKMCEGPRTIILKRNAKHEDYNKVTTAKARGSDIDKFPQDIVNGAEIFIALHQQLLIELPLLLEGFAAILHMVVRSLMECQARYYRGVHALLSCFWAEYPPVTPDPEGVGIISGGLAIIQAWEEASARPSEMMEALNITKKISVRLLDAPVRIATSSHQSNLRRKQSYPSSRSSNFSSSAISTPNSVSSNRARSSSLSTIARPNPATTDHPPMPNTSEEILARNGMSNLRKKPSQRGESDRTESEKGSSTSLGIFSATNTPSCAINRSDSSMQLNSDRRSVSSANSIGPALSAMSFEGSESSHFGESVIQKITNVHATPSPKKRASLPHLSPASLRSIDPRSPSFAERSFDQTEGEEGPGETPTKLNLMKSSRSAGGEREEVLYRCQCVAEFDLQGVELSFMGNPFLRIKRGEIIDIVEEVGRVDELPDHFPLDVGLEDDGLLLGITSAGQKGFVLCSFLNPLF
ncbi:Invasion-inducing protein TIAM1/CDC24 and related RhoGEF GTPases [Phaffia rhodozyma]|uniref:Invasion-inducing protein TIAM1/CDC24 and related RhoGEF GTPases n=1 Tax=Phaffia rhodozyma TaxID=264483 RepID=A0A0F7SM70_PHARH|nr:Invasion-inducing protein TIAM1/CDC24 and related RhoGEF GTPases [Phaffia rhodozyma]